MSTDTPKCRVLGCDWKPLTAGRCVQHGHGPGRGHDMSPVDCGRKKRRGHLTCGPCWAQVPPDLQCDVYATLKAWRRDLGDADALQAYRAAALAAVKSVTG